jgi:DNA-binding Lrp family transcriptional regulator
MALSDTNQSVLNVLIAEAPCTLSYEALSLKANCSYRSVCRAVKRLTDEGLLQVSGTRGRGNHLTFDIPNEVRVMMQVNVIYGARPQS